MVKEIKKVDVDDLRFEISNYFKNEEGEIDDKVNVHLVKIEEDYSHSKGVLNHFVRYHFIGYINYSLIKVFQKLANSSLLNKRIEEYEKDYKCFLELSLKNIHNVFQQWPDHRSEYPAGIPKFKLHLQSEWEGKSMLELREFLQQCRLNRSDIDQLMITKIEESCIIVTFAVLPHIAKRVIECLTSDDVASVLKSNGVSVDISPELDQYLPTQEPVKSYWDRDTGLVIMLKVRSYLTLTL